MNVAKYREILDENLLQRAQGHRLRHRFTFQQNDEPNQTANTTQEWLRDIEEFECLKVMTKVFHPETVELCETC
jgi:hypothetical protein